jgi:ubiquinone/menaquinone biosynthesis C-methylase UbiE
MVSGESFPVWECEDCTLRFTQDIPDPGHIGDYYRSESYISHSDQAPGMINQVYRLVRKRTLASKRKLVIKTSGLSGGRLLDIGAGTGAFANEMKRKNGWDVTGLEPDPGARQVALSNYALELQEAASLFSMPERSFDVITMWHVLEHVHDLHGYMDKLRLLLKETGFLFIAVPNYTAKDSAIYGSAWAAYDVPRHLYHFSPASMKTLVSRHRFVMETEKPMWFDGFYISMLSSKYKNRRTNFPAAFINGLRSNFAALGNVEKCSSVTYVLK